MRCNLIRLEELWNINLPTWKTLSQSCSLVYRRLPVSYLYKTSSILMRKDLGEHPSFPLSVGYLI
jgi:hypothetical protein